MQGTIFDISHYMIEDGPGIRTNVFVKGCPLRCNWCSNAYGLEKELQLAFYNHKCTGCGACLLACPSKAITLQKEKASKNRADEKKEVALTNRDLCKNCFACVDVCKCKARIQVGRKMYVSEVVREVARDRMFYRRGGGGVTVSGGEILMQSDFVIQFLKKCQDDYLNTAIETSGFGSWEDLAQMITYSNLVFIDCKLIEEARHKAATGVSNQLILNNIRQSADLCEIQKKQMVIRMPLIPGINDDKDNLIETAEFVRSLPGNVELNVLPYHNYGSDKYEKIGMKYKLKDIRPPAKEELERTEQFLCSTKVRFSIGGYQIDYTSV